MTSEKELKLFSEEMVPIADKIKKEIIPFLDKIRNLNTQSRKFKFFKDEIVYYLDNIKRLEKIVNITYISLKSSEKKIKDKMHFLFSYLGAIEGLGNPLADILVILLIGNGFDFPITKPKPIQHVKFITSIKDLEKDRVSLGKKFRFLEKNGFKELSSVINTKLRNKIAHLNFDLREDEIYFDENIVALPLVRKSFYKLIFSVERVNELLEKLVKEKNI